MFRRKQDVPAKPSAAMATVERRPLTAEDMASFYESAEMRTSGMVPSIYDLEKLCQLMMNKYPADARYTLRQLKWLMTVAEKEHQAGWSHPWDQTPSRR